MNNHPIHHDDELFAKQQQRLQQLDECIAHAMAQDDSWMTAMAATGEPPPPPASSIITRRNHHGGGLLSTTTSASFSSPTLPAQQQQDESLVMEDEDLAAAMHASERQAQEERLHCVWTESAQERGRDRHGGAWDCPGCTLVNEPYAAVCAACHDRPPPGVLAFQTVVQTINFGVEVEIVLPEGSRDGWSWETVARDLTRMGPPAVRYCGYTHETTAHWKVVTDASIRGDTNKDLCFELVSPVLRGTEGLESLRSVMENIRRLGIATNSSCGFHVHVDADEDESPIGTVTALQRVAQCFVSLENAFDLLVANANKGVAAHRRANANRFCRSNRLSFGEKSNRQRWNQIASATTRAQLVELMNPAGDRYRKLNMTNLTKPSRPSTCEFRQHGGIQDLHEAEAWVRLILAFCVNAAAGGRTYAACLLPEHATPKMEVQALFDLVGCPGLEQYFAVERRLFGEADRLRNDWTCLECSKTFRDCRSLSQHCLACGH